MEPRTADDESESWLKQNANQRRIFEQFVAQLMPAWLIEFSIQAGEGWAQLKEAVLCAILIWGLLATFLAEVYKIPAGKKNIRASTSSCRLWSAVWLPIHPGCQGALLCQWRRGSQGAVGAPPLCLACAPARPRAPIARAA